MGLNFFTYTSNYRVILEFLAELVAGIFFLLYLMNGFDLVNIFYVYSVKHLMLLPDYIYTRVKGALHFNDLCFGIGNFLYYGSLSYALIYPEKDSYLYIASIVKLCIDILFYSTALAFRENPVSFLH